MSLISVTRLRVRSYWYMPPFAWYTVRCAWQARRAGGFLGGRLMGGARKTYWTAMAWADEAAMMAYRDSGAHLKAMRKLPAWCDEASHTFWAQESATLPRLKEAHRRLRDEGRPAKVRHPSPAHAAGQTAEPECALRYARPVLPIKEAAD